MDEIDSLVGFWIRDVPYVFENKGLAEESIRKYMQSFPEFDKIRYNPTDCAWVTNYFRTNTSWLKTIMSYVHTAAPVAYQNGRVYYYTPDHTGEPKEFTVILPVLENYHTELSDALVPYNGKEFDLASLICTQMSAGRPLEWQEVFELMKNCPPVSECDPCTKVGTKVAKSLIKIAALRIFADPEQSIMELPVNSIDAYNPERKIGKFGMGFFSILYWLVGHPKRTMTIHSFYKIDDKYVTYQVVIREINGSLSFALTVYPGSKIFTTGFRIYFDASQDKFHPDVVKKFREQLSKLDYSTGSTIYKSEKSDRDFREAKIINPGTNKRIFCSITTDYLLNEDFATGVPLEVLLGSLFVPSISTKTIQLSNTGVSFVNNSRLVRNTGGRNLLFLIGGIAVISITDTNSYGPRCAQDTYIIDLPSTTRLPVSRDDFILSEETEATLLESIDMVFEAAKKIKDAACFQTLLEKYIEFTPSSENKVVVRKAMTNFFVKNKGQLIPMDHRKVYERINPKFVVSKVYDVTSIEDWLDKNTNPDKNVWYGTKVLIVNGLGDNTSNGGLVSYLFIDEQYKKRLGANWIYTVTSSVFGRKLFPVGSSYGAKEYAKYEGIVKDKSPTKIIGNEVVRNYYFAVLNKLESLEDRFDVLPHVLPDLADHLLSIFSLIPEDSFLLILTELMAKFSSFKGNQTYGGGKYMLNYSFGKTKLYINPAIIFTGASEKFISYTVESIIYAIRAIEEENVTNLVILTQNCPGSFIGSSHSDNAKTFYREVMSQSVNYIEFILLYGGSGMAISQTPQRIPDEIIRQIVNHFIEKIRFHQRNSNDVVYLFESWKNKSPNIASGTFIFLIKDREEAAEWINTAIGISNIPKGKEIQKPSGVNVNLSSLTRTLFKTDLPHTSGLTDERNFYYNIPQEETKGKLQIIEIAVNEGTVKPFVEATMTELVQNSIDAVREYKPKNTNIDIKVSKTDTHVILEIVDRVGMSEDAFVYVGVPFLSTKTPSELVTGEMGSGFFNAYRESDRLKIDTVIDGVNRVSIDTPVRDERGRVVDIIKSISIQPMSFDNQTTISISIPVKEDSHFANIISRAVYTATNVLGLAMAENIKFNGKSVYVKRELVAKFGYFELYSTSKHILKHESFLLTKGVPFAPLAGYFKNMITSRASEVIDRNIILNITHGGYTPVQTRTRINLAPEVEKDFKKAAIYAVFISMLVEISEGHRLYALDHINSSSDPRQLKFTIYNIETQMSYADETWYLKFTKFYDQPSIAELINGCIDLGKDKMMDPTARLEFIKSKYESPYHLVNARVITVVQQWFRPKNLTQTPKKIQSAVKAKAKTTGKRSPGGYKKLTIPQLKDLLRERKIKVSGKKDELISRLIESDDLFDEVEDEEDKDIPDPEITHIVNTWVKIFWQSAIAAKIKGYNGAPPVCNAVCSEKDQSKLGYFMPGAKTITINTFTWSKSDRTQILSVLKKKNAEDFVSGTLKKNKVWDMFFSYSVPASTISHELEHARRGNAHGATGGHDSISSPIFEGDSGIIRSFNECCNVVFEKVLASGFHEKFLNAL